MCSYLYLLKNFLHQFDLFIALIIYDMLYLSFIKFQTRKWIIELYLYFGVP